MCEHRWLERWEEHRWLYQQCHVLLISIQSLIQQGIDNPQEHELWVENKKKDVEDMNTCCSRTYETETRTFEQKCGNSHICYRIDLQVQICSKKDLRLSSIWFLVERLHGYYQLWKWMSGRIAQGKHRA